MGGRSGRENPWGWTDRPTMNDLFGWLVGLRGTYGGWTDRPTIGGLDGWLVWLCDPMGDGLTDQPSVEERRAGVVAIGVRFFVLETPSGISLNQVPCLSISGADYGSFW